MIVIERFVPSKGWAEMIRKVYETDPVLCPRCAGQMHVHRYSLLDGQAGNSSYAPQGRPKIAFSFDHQKKQPKIS